MILENGWMINHHGGPEGYLGWLMLSPVRHVMSLGELKDTESKALGVSLNRLDRALRTYWPITFGEPLERVYVCHFFEGQALADNALWHLHFHIIPRPKSFPKEWWAWNIPEAYNCSEFPDAYAKSSAGFESGCESLMEYLRSAVVPAA